MSTYAKSDDDPKHVEAGKLLAQQLHEARETKGEVLCPNCHLVFNATYVLKCPGCRTFISKAFKELCPTLFSEVSSETGTSPANSEAQYVSKKRGAGKARKKTRRTSLRKRRKKVELNLDFFTQGYMEYPG